MGKHESAGKSDEWYTPVYIFDAMSVVFDMDVAAPLDLTHVHVPAWRFITENSLDELWDGFVWMNPPYGHQRGKIKWLDKFFAHGDGVALMPDRTSAAWWQAAAQKSDALLMVSGKIKFIKPDGSLGEQPGNGTTLFAVGPKGVSALRNANKKGLGILLVRKLLA